MAILSESSVVHGNGSEQTTYKVFNDESVDETASDDIDISNAKEVTLLVESGAGVSGGVVKLEVAAVAGGPYFVAGTVTTGAASTGYADTIGSGDAGLPANFARARIETAISGGTVDAYIIVTR